MSQVHGEAKKGWLDMLFSHRNPDLPLSAVDGKLAAITTDGVSFITTPNADYIPSPPAYTSDCVIRRLDGRFGHEDYIHWPQPYNKRNPHHACILRKQTTGPLAVIWLDLNESHFDTLEHNPRMGRMAGTTLGELRTCVDDLISRTHTWKQDNPTSSALTIVNPLMLSLSHAFSQLECLALTFSNTSLVLRSIQRAWLELQAVIEYVDVFQQRMNGRVTPPSPHDIAPTIGAFVSITRQAQDLFTARIPFWFIKPINNFTIENILELTTLTWPSPDRLAIPAISTPISLSSTTNQDCARINAIVSSDREILTHPDPFQVAEPLQPIQLSTPTPVSHTARFTPYKGTNERKPNFRVPLDAFQPITRHAVVPHSLAIWENTLKSVKPDQALLIHASRRRVDDGKHMFPPLRVFASVTANASRLSQFITTWTTIREPCIYRAIYNEYASPPLSIQAWRDLLMTTTNPRFETVIQSMSNVFNDFGINAQYLSSRPVTSRSNDEIKRVLWELAEYNFRSDLCALDSRITRSDVDRDTHNSILQMCLAPKKSTRAGLLVFDHRDVETGLATHDAEQKKHLLTNMRSLMQGWDTQKEGILLETKTVEGSRYLERLERAIAEEKSIRTNNNRTNTTRSNSAQVGDDVMDRIMDQLSTEGIQSQDHPTRNPILPKIVRVDSHTQFPNHEGRLWVLLQDRRLEAFEKLVEEVPKWKVPQTEEEIINEGYTILEASKGDVAFVRDVQRGGDDTDDVLKTWAIPRREHSPQEQADMVSMRTKILGPERGLGEDKPKKVNGEYRGGTAFEREHPNAALTEEQRTYLVSTSIQHHNASGNLLAPCAAIKRKATEGVDKVSGVMESLTKMAASISVKGMNKISQQDRDVIHDLADLTNMPRIGVNGNVYHPTMQLNIASASRTNSQSLSASLGAFGGVHIDERDSCLVPTALTVLTEDHEDIGPVFIILVDLGLAWKLEQLSTIFFNGLHYHVPTTPSYNPGPRKSVKPYYRITLVNYPPSAVIDNTGSIAFASLPHSHDRLQITKELRMPTSKPTANPPSSGSTFVHDGSALMEPHDFLDMVARSATQVISHIIEQAPPELELQFDRNTLIGAFSMRNGDKGRITAEKWELGPGDSEDEPAEEYPSIIEDINDRVTALMNKHARTIPICAISDKRDSNSNDIIAPNVAKRRAIVHKFQSRTQRQKIYVKPNSPLNRPGYPIRSRMHNRETKTCYYLRN
ncbi:hypothetical protein BDN72DRAFT_905487 [Pluteus cervinus]|uniref:Uncharacterized protein n=1 Tax=Pluteus cervinus TaxID=181527 RepID=A0ACD3A2G9_9AGAR|nr:hypothetical protein BDN72DRAFT_905487 [Pluteus cervinus]